MNQSKATGLSTFMSQTGGRIKVELVRIFACETNGQTLPREVTCIVSVTVHGLNIPSDLNDVATSLLMIITR